MFKYIWVYPYSEIFLKPLKGYSLTGRDVQDTRLSVKKRLLILFLKEKRKRPVFIDQEWHSEILFSSWIQLSLSIGIVEFCFFKIFQWACTIFFKLKHDWCTILYVTGVQYNYNFFFFIVKKRFIPKAIKGENGRTSLRSAFSKSRGSGY